MSIKLNIRNAGLRDHEPEYVRPLAETASMLLTERTGQGADMPGWLDLPHACNREEFARIKAAARRIRPKDRCWCPSASAAVTRGPGRAWSLSGALRQPASPERRRGGRLRREQSQLRLPAGHERSGHEGHPPGPRGRRAFSRRTALKNLEMRSVFPGFFALSSEKISRVWAFCHVSNRL